MTDLNKLRQLAQANYESNSVDSLYALQDAFDYKTVLDLLDRLEAAEKERDELLAGFDEWLDKTKWVQQGINEGTISAKYLGLHRADVMTSLLGEAEKERDDVAQQLVQSEQGKRKISEECDALSAELSKQQALTDAAQHIAEVAQSKANQLQARITEMEQQEPVGVLHVGSYYGEELQDWEFEADQRVCDHLNERHVTNPTSLKLYALPGAQGEEK